MAHGSTHRAALGYVSSDAMLPKARREDLRSRPRNQYYATISAVSRKYRSLQCMHRGVKRPGYSCVAPAVGPPFRSCVSLSVANG